MCVFLGKSSFLLLFCLFFRSIEIFFVTLQAETKSEYIFAKL